MPDMRQNRGAVGGADPFLQCVEAQLVQSVQRFGVRDRRVPIGIERPLLKIEDKDRQRPRCRDLGVKLAE